MFIYIYNNQNYFRDLSSSYSDYKKKRKRNKTCYRRISEQWKTGVSQSSVLMIDAAQFKTSLFSCDSFIKKNHSTSMYDFLTAALSRLSSTSVITPRFATYVHPNFGLFISNYQQSMHRPKLYLLPMTSSLSKWWEKSLL